MTARARGTTKPPAQPVRFYKTVALTFLLLTILLLGVVIFMSAKRATITVIAKHTPVDVNSTANIGVNGDVSGSVSTTQITLSEIFFPTGSKTEEGVAKGTVIVTNDSNSSQPLIATTRFLSADGILFRLEDGVTVPANGSVEAIVYADQSGATGDIGPTNFTIPGLNETRQKEVYGKSSVDMKGGVKTIGVLSEKDVEESKKKLLARAENEAKRIFGEVGEGQLFAVLESSVTSNANIGEEVSEYTLTMNATISTVSYDTEAMKEWATQLLSTRIVDDTEVIEASKDNPVVTFSSFDPELDTVNVNVFYDGIASVNPNSTEFDKAFFYGKTKDEVRRYVLSLDHVEDVEVNVTPGWIRTIPHIDDHVNIVIKSIR